MSYSADQLPDGLDAGSTPVGADLYVGEHSGAVVKFTHTQLMAAIIAILGDTDGTLAGNSASRIAVQSAVKTYVDARLAGLSWKQAVRAATTANGTLASAFANGSVIDGVTLATGDRILLKNQSTGSQNGIYVVAASGAPTRATDADSAAELVNASVYVSEGTVNADLQFVCSTDAPITVGSTALTFALFSSGGSGDALVANPLSQFAATTSAQLRGVLSDETGTGAAVFNNAPALINPTATTQTARDSSGLVATDAFAEGAARTVQRVQVISGSAMYAFGDSFTTGSGATNARWYYVNRIATALGLTLTNKGLSGSASFYSTQKAFADVAAQRRSTLLTWMSAFNDIYRNGAAAATLTKIKGELRAFLANAFLETAVPGNSGTITLSGSWTTMDASLNDKSSQGLSAFGKYTYDPTATASWTFTGDTLVVGCYNGLGTSGFRVGAFDVVVDGTTLETYNGDGLADGISDGVYDNKLTHEARVYKGLGSGSHTVVITASGAIGPSTAPFYLDYLGTLAQANNAGPVIVAEPAFLNAAGYTHGGGLWSQAAMIAAAQAINAVVEEFHDYPITVAKVNNFYSTTTGVSGDDEHPNDLGHGQIAAAFEQCVFPIRATGTGTVTNTGGNLTANAVVLGAGVADSKVVAGISTDGTSALNLGVAGASVGKVVLANGTSGTITVQPPTGALGSVTVSIPARTDTLANLAGSQAFTNKTYEGNTLTAGTFTLTGASGKTFTFSNTLTLAGTDGTTMTFPPASASIGYLNIPQNSQSAAYTTVLADAGKHLLHPAADTTARTFTIDSNGAVAYPIGTAITFVNQHGAGVLTIAIATDTMRLAGPGTTGSRTLAADGIATALKIATTEWIISGTGLT